jgi:alpha-tubulin suppressor-like RCC1 family protein
MKLGMWTLIAGLALVIGMMAQTVELGEEALADSPHTGLDFHLGIDADGDTLDDCDTATAGQNVCYMPLGTVFSARVHLDSSGLSNYSGYEARLDYAGVDDKASVTHHWPECAFEGNAGSPGTRAIGCAAGMSVTSTYTGLMGEAAFTCSASGYMSLVHGLANTDLVELSLVSHAESGSETLDVVCADLDFHAGIDVDGDTTDDCSTHTLATPGKTERCFIQQGGTFDVKLYLDSFGSLGSYSSFEAFLFYSGVTDKASITHDWPECDFPASAPGAGTLAFGCVASSPSTSTYTGVLARATFICNKSGTLAFLHGSGLTGLVDSIAVEHYEPAGSAEALQVICTTSGATGVTLGSGHTCSAAGTGDVYCWGLNSGGQLGDGTIFDSTIPVQVAGLSSDATQIAGGLEHTCALLDSGQVECWGTNFYGQLGDGTNTASSSPVAVSGLSNVVDLAAGNYYTCAITSSSLLHCWGRNDFGQLGDGTTTNSNAPVLVASGMVQVDAGNVHACAVDTTAGLHCWGDNTFGQFGDGTTTGSLTPTGVGIAVHDVTAGANFTCVIPAGSPPAVECAGQNSFGQLGDGTNSDSTTWVATGAGAVVDVMAELFHACALDASGGLKCWGRNDFGQLGDGTTLHRNSPTTILTGGVARLGTGPASSHTCVVTNVGGVKCWGDNTYGQLGETTGANSTTPVDVLAPGFAVSAPTTSGTDVSVTVANTSLGNVTLTFDEVTSDGDTVFTTEEAVSIPGGFQIAGYGAFDISTSANFSGVVEVCLDYSGMAVTPETEASMRLYHDHDDNGTYDDVTTFQDSATDVLCGEVTSFSWFVTVQLPQFEDYDGDGCITLYEYGSDPMAGGKRDPFNPYDYFNPTGDGENRIDDVLAVINQYFDDDDDGNPGLPPYEPGYNPNTDRTSLGPDQWNLGPPNGEQRIDDVLAIIYQYFHDCS